MKLTLVIGASENTERYSNRVVRMLHYQNIPVVAIGVKAGEIYPVGNTSCGVDGIKIQTGFPKIEKVDTVTLYVGPVHQPQYYDYVLSIKPQRVIFNPGTENPEFEKKIRDAGIEVMEACTLTMLSIGNY